MDAGVGAAAPPAGTVDGRKLTAVVYADMVGYSRLIGLDDAGTFARLQELRRDLIDPSMTRHGGMLVNTAGDSLLVTFDSIIAAMRFAVDMQRAIPEFDSEHPPDRQIRFRIGVTVGDVIQDGTSMHGEGVNIAARLQTVCPPGSICVSRVVRDQVGNRLGLPFKELGAIGLKNIARPVEAFVLDPAPGGVASAPMATGGRRAALHGARFALVGIGALAVVGSAALAWELRSRPMSPVAGNATPNANAPGAVQDHEPPPLSIAVLPFTNLSGDADQAYLADGIAEDLTTDLSHLAGAFVISRESAFSYRGKQIDIREIGRQLGVRYLLEGSVRKIGTNVRINAQLISAENGSHVWAERFDKPVASLGEGQDDIVAPIGSALNVKLVNLEGARRARAQSGTPAAFDLVLRARAVLAEPPSEENAYLALGYFIQAMRADPSSVPAMAGAAAIYAGRFSRFSTTKRAAELVAKAETLAPDSPDVQVAKFLLLQRELHTREAIALYKHLLDVAPGATALVLDIGLWRNWATPEEALAVLEKTIRVDPKSPKINTIKTELARNLLLTGRPDEARLLLERLVSADDDHSAPQTAGDNPDERQVRSWQNEARLILAIAYVRTDRMGDAHRVVEQALQIPTMREFTVQRFLRGIRLYDRAENVARLRQLGEDLRRAGVPDHLDEMVDSGVTSTGDLREFTETDTPTPMAIPLGRTLKTADVVDMLAHRQPVILTSTNTVPTIPGTIFIEMPSTGSFDDEWQTRLGRLMQELCGNNVAKTILVFGYNLNRWDSRNLALRLIALGYTDVNWYRGGWEAWEASGQPRGPMGGRRNL